ncbi:MAG: carboxylesterase family protein [Oscillospiraceae bacterium]|nr:carboxylesterase family protein [Oscillospiraceae bacterium]
MAARKPGILLEESKRWSLKCQALGLNSYVYYFRHELPDEGGKTAPSFHSAELWYMQGTLGRCWRPMTEEDRAISGEMVTAWSNFMRTGSPGPGWPAYRAERPFVKTF